MNLLAIPSAHAFERFNERVRPTLSPEASAHELVRLLVHHARPVAECPPWTREKDDARLVADGWLLVGDDIALPVTKGVALTCVTRAGLSEGSREHLSRAKKLAKGARRAQGQDNRAWRRERKGQRAKGRRFDPELEAA